MIRALVVVCLVAALAPLSAEQKGKPERVRVYFEPLPAPTSGFVDVGTKRLADSHADLAKKLGGQKHFTVVATPEGADAVVTLISSREEDFSRAVTAVGPGFAVTRKTLPTVRVRLKAGDYERELVAQSTWGGAAEKIAEELNDWAKDNQALLLSKRPMAASRP